MRKSLVVIGLLVAVVAAPSAAHAKRLNIVLNYGQDVHVTGDDALSIRAQCVQNDGGFGYDVARVYLTTTGNAVVRSTGQNYYGNGSYVTPLTPPNLSTVIHGLANTGFEIYTTGIDAGSALDVGTMRGFTVNAESTVFGFNTESGDCLISVNLTAIKKFKETF